MTRSGAANGGAPARFLNVDLDLESAESLSPLIAALLPVAFDLHHEPTATGFRATLELNGVGPFDPDSAIRAFAAALLSLPAEPRRVWDHASARVFSIGIEAGTAPGAFHAAVQAATLQMVAALGASLEVTVYRARDDPPG